MATVSVTAKKCVNCHKDVTNDKRMKDSHGRYWCVACGEADKKKKASSIGEACASCGERYPAAKLTKMGASKICAGCIKRRNKGPGVMASIKGGGGGGMDKGRLIKMLVIMGILAAGFAWMNFG